MGALAADASGALWFESGDPAEGLLTKVVSTISVPVIRTGVASLGQAADDVPRRTSLRRQSASLLAASGDGGLFLALPKAVVEFAQDFTLVAGAVPSPGIELAPGQAGDGGPLREARFERVSAIAGDGAGNIYVVDRIDRDETRISIRFLNRSDQPRKFYADTARELTVEPGTIETIAGAEGMPAGAIAAEAPALTVAPDRLYLAAAGPAGGATVRMLNLGAAPLSMHGVTVSPGDLAKVASVAAVTTSGGGPAAASAVSGIAADEQGSVFIAEPENHRVRRLNAAGAVTTFAGTGAAGFNGNDRRATQARLDRPYDVEVGAGGRIYISDAGNAQVRVVDQAGTIRTALGNGTTNKWLCANEASAGAATSEARRAPSRGEPTGVAGDEAGNAFIISSKLGRVHRLAPSGSMRPIAGGSCDEVGACVAGEDAPLGETDLSGISAIRPGPSGGFYLMEANRARFLNLAPGILRVQGVEIGAGEMRTVAGEPPPAATQPPTATAPPSTQPLEATPRPTTPDGDRAVGDKDGVVYTALAEDGSGNLLIADVPRESLHRRGNGSVRRVDTRGILTTLVERAGPGPDNRADLNRCCHYPSGLAIGPRGSLYVADATANRVWFFNRSRTAIVAHGVSVGPGAVEAVAGAGNTGSQEEGVAALEARLTTPRGVALDGDGNLYVVDSSEHSVHRVDARGVITTVAGNGQPGFNGDGLKGPIAALRSPSDLAFDSCGNLLITDPGNDRVRRLNLVTSCSMATAKATTEAPGVWRYAVAGGLIGLALSVGGIVSRRRRRRRNEGSRGGQGE